jgi:hypothetical protein
VSTRLNLIAPMLALILLATNSRADHELVLIARHDSPLTTISSLDLRKVYLGFVVNAPSGRQIYPIANNSDARAKEIFLQDVVGMSARTYDRRLLTLTLQTGRHRPVSFTELEDVLGSIADNSFAIAFVWREDVENRDDVKILRVLWQH